MRKERRGARLRALISDRRGASAVEYGLILSLVFLAVMGAIATLGSSVQARWNDIAEKVTSL
ncbi:Flp family type IVb pilin [Rhizorhabdus dicambivorans]|uniref:Flp family type IVb pilin n=1 Tax=Rhizorhabdus dicambivorans TaxID=1850238 RepID=A0A2A4G1D2_9SPHN|nr:Flp family type IVb pilin [Rhizorhabdus dicambivorans]ATE65018.1 Flp family type IVb pilin [Rhizorhabdus dicambivorans]PCE44291.1 Flp family type IVb pilin [Rhizorhabdus dicambivorans]